MIERIESEADHQKALKRVEELWQAQRGTPEGEEFDRLVDLIESYEDVHFPMGDQKNKLTPREVVSIGTSERSI